MCRPMEIAKSISVVFQEKSEFDAGKIIRDVDDSPELCADMTILDRKTGKECSIPAKFWVTARSEVILTVSLPNVPTHKLPAIFEMLNTLNDEYDPKFYVTFPLRELRIREIVCCPYPKDARTVGLDAYECWQKLKIIMTCCIPLIAPLLND